MVQIIIHGKVDSKKRPRVGKFKNIYSPSTDWDKIVLRHAKELNLYFDGALRVDCDFYFQRPKSHYRTGKFAHLLKDSSPKHHINKPDRDNCDKAVLDGLTKGGIFSDDCIIIDGRIRKFWGEDFFGAIISVSEVN